MAPARHISVSYLADISGRIMLFRRAHFCIYHLNDLSYLNHASELTGFGTSSLALVGPQYGDSIGNDSVG
jgi:hypothetical protein